MIAKVRFPLLGLVFLAIIALFIAVCLGFYTKKFTPVSWIRLETDKIGNQLRIGADVKARGVLVGEVRSVTSTGDHAVLDLALEPGKIGEIPKNVSARLLPKTLFGERYVSLEIPHQRSGTLAAGDVITQDRSSAAMEIEKVLGDLMPVLQALQPQKVSSTLTALAQTLQGRGEQLGQTAVQLDDYLGKLNPSLPQINADIRSLAAVSDVYDRVAPDLLGSLANLSTTTRTVADKKTELTGLYETLTTTSVDLGAFLEVNQNNIIQLAATARPTLDVLAKYAPEYPCMLTQMAEQIPRGNRTMGEGQEFKNMGRLTIELTQSRGKYVPGVDTPKYADKRGPRCYEAATPQKPFPQYPPDGPINDGSTKPPLPLLQGGMSGGGGSSAGSTVPLVANSPAERDLIGAFAAPTLGVPPSEVPGWSSLLLGPLYRGTEVTVQ